MLQPLSLLCLAAVSFASLDFDNSAGLDNYEATLMQGLYKRLAEMENNPYLTYDLNDLNDPYLKEGDLGLDLGQSSAAAIRDSEYIQHSSSANDDFIHMTGGAGEGKQHIGPDGSINNLKEGQIPPVKSDESLPFYCHPANPCPKGFTSKDGCQENVEDTADAQKQWITSMQQHGYCTCDKEHMFDCPAEDELEHERVDVEDKSLEDIMNKIIADREAATYMSGERRSTLVAKKSPRMKREAEVPDMERELKVFQNLHKKSGKNPYLNGERLRTVAKKG